MPTISRNDELNNLSSKSSSGIKKRSVPYEEYFLAMEISEEEADARIALAESLDDVFIYLFMFMATTEKVGQTHDFEYLYDLTERRIEEALIDNNIHLEDYPRLQEYIPTLSMEVVNTTASYIGDAYYTSNDRAMFVAENEANTMANVKGFEDAVRAGYKYKSWITMKDEKVRTDHWLVDGETIGIMDAFEVGDTQMLFPRDNSLGAGAKQIVNCRCFVEYKRDKNVRNPEREAESNMGLSGE